jgi:hypothetical protein
MMIPVVRDCDCRQVGQRDTMPLPLCFQMTRAPKTFYVAIIIFISNVLITNV